MALKSYWKLEDLTDEQALHDIVNTGSADQVANGYDFESDDSEYMTVVDTGNDYDPLANEGFTIIMWANIRNNAGYQRLISKYDGTYGYEIVVWNTGKLRFGCKSTGSYRYIETDNVYWGTGYHMIAIRRVASSTTIKIWIDDGIADNKSGLGYSGTFANALALHIGRYAVSGSSYADAEIGNTNGEKPSMGIQYYDTELSDEELSALFESSQPFSLSPSKVGSLSGGIPI